MKISNSNVKKFVIFCQKKPVLFQETKTRKKFLTFSQKKVFLSFGKWKTFQGMEPLKNILHFRRELLGSKNEKKPWNFLASSLKNFFYLRRNFQSSKNHIFLYFSTKSYELIFLKTLWDNSFHFFYKLNQTILLVYK